MKGLGFIICLVVVATSAGIARAPQVVVADSDFDFGRVLRGTLVEHQYVVVADEEFRQRHAAPLAAGEVCDRRVPVETREQPGGDIAHARIARPFVLGKVADDGRCHGVIVVQGVALIQDADGHATADRHPAAVWFEPPGEHRQQAGLAVAVTADDADPVALVDAQGDGVEHDLGGRRHSVSSLCGHSGYHS